MREKRFNLDKVKQIGDALGIDWISLGRTILDGA